MEMITDYEVEGCWSSPNQRIKLGQELTRCRHCGAIQELVPETGHFNSKYWERQMNDGLYLVCCPKGCSEKDASSTMKEYLIVGKYCTPESQSYKWEIDFSSFRNAWIDRYGKVYPVGEEQHIFFAENVLKSSEQKLEDRGWAKITIVDWMAICMDERGFSCRQLDTIFDFCIAHGLKTVGLYELDQYGVYSFES